MDSTLKLDEKQTISSIPKDADNAVASIDGPPTFVSTDPTVVQVVTVSGAGFPDTNWLVAMKVGTCGVVVTAVQGGLPTASTVNMTVTPDPIADLGIVLGVPVTQ
jgi:hypothetical protein